jgi:hypothetical protein
MVLYVTFYGWHLVLHLSVKIPTFECKKIHDWAQFTYVDENSKYPPTMWALKPCSTAKRTNNGPESFHSHFNYQVYSAHPCIYVFIDVLKQIQTTTYIKIRGLDNPTTVRRTEKDKLASSLEQYRMLETGEIYRATYMKSMGLKFSARTNLWDFSPTSIEIFKHS